MKNAISEMKKTLRGINNKLAEAEGQISDLEDTVAENTQSEQKKKIEILKKEDDLRDFWGNIKHNNIQI